MANRVVEAPSKPCIHHWEIDNHNVGQCRKCGEERQYPWDLKGQVVVLRRGQMEETRGENPQSELKRRGRLKRAERSELLSIGPEAFAKKYGYPPKTAGILHMLYRRWGGSPRVRDSGNGPGPGPASSTLSGIVELVQAMQSIGLEPQITLSISFIRKHQS